MTGKKLVAILITLLFLSGCASTRHFRAGNGGGDGQPPTSQQTQRMLELLARSRGVILECEAKAKAEREACELRAQTASSLAESRARKLEEQLKAAVARPCNDCLIPIIIASGVALVAGAVIGVIITFAVIPKI